MHSYDDSRVNIFRESDIRAVNSLWRCTSVCKSTAMTQSSMRHLRRWATSFRCRNTSLTHVASAAASTSTRSSVTVQLNRDHSSAQSHTWMNIIKDRGKHAHDASFTSDTGIDKITSVIHQNKNCVILQTSSLFIQSSPVHNPQEKYFFQKSV